MRGWNGKRIAMFGLAGGLALFDGGLQVACHHKSLAQNSVQPPILSYQTPAILATVGQTYASVAPDVQAYVMTNGVASMVTTGFGFAVIPSLPANLRLDPATGVISGIPLATLASRTYSITATNSAGPSIAFPLALGVVAATQPPVALTYPVTGTVSMEAGSKFPFPLDGLPVVANGTALGFGISPALPAGLAFGNNGVLSGTATATAPAALYTVTATTQNGSANAQFTLVVTRAAFAASGLAYPVLTASAGTAYASAAPTVVDGGQTLTVTSDLGLTFTVSPDLPTGLSLDPLTGIISGTAAATPQAFYTVTATNSLGPTSANVSLAVE